MRYTNTSLLYFTVPKTERVFVDSELGAATHVRRTVSRCFAALRQLHHLRRFIHNFIHRER